MKEFAKNEILKKSTNNYIPNNNINNIEKEKEKKNNSSSIKNEKKSSDKLKSKNQKHISSYHPWSENNEIKSSSSKLNKSSKKSINKSVHDPDSYLFHGDEDKTKYEETNINNNTIALKEEEELSDLSNKEYKKNPEEDEKYKINVLLSNNINVKQMARQKKYNLRWKLNLNDCILTRDERIPLHKECKYIIKKENYLGEICGKLERDW